MIFKKYSNSGYKTHEKDPTFDKVNFKKIHLPEILKMLWDNHVIPEVLTIPEATKLVRLININKNDIKSLEFEEFIFFFL